MRHQEIACGAPLALVAAGGRIVDANGWRLLDENSGRWTGRLTGRLEPSFDQAAVSDDGNVLLVAQTQGTALVEHHQGRAVRQAARPWGYAGVDWALAVWSSRNTTWAVTTSLGPRDRIPGHGESFIELWQPGNPRRHREQVSFRVLQAAGAGNHLILCGRDSDSDVAVAGHLTGTGQVRLGEIRRAETLLVAPVGDNRVAVGSEQGIEIVDLEGVAAPEWATREPGGWAQMAGDGGDGLIVTDREGNTSWVTPEGRTGLGVIPRRWVWDSRRRRLIEATAGGVRITEPDVPRR